MGARALSELTASGERDPGDARPTALAALNADIVTCRACPRLVEWRERVAVEKRAAYSDHDYWGRPVPSFGDPNAWMLLLGLAPGAHGSNRTGRQFTGDRSGIWLFAALHRAGLSDRAESVARDDGLKLNGVWITASVRCAPPANKPNTEEWANCRPFLDRELDALTGVKVILALGGFSFGRALQVLKARGLEVPTPRPKFGHGAEVPLDGVTLLGSYHPSQQNTFTGRLTEAMLDDVLGRAKEIGHAKDA